MTQPLVAVLDYGSGNLRSAQRALVRAGARVLVTPSCQLAAEADGLVVPGVGAYAACMAGIEGIGAAKMISERFAAGRPVLGICVGMQVLFERGEEHGASTEGIGLIEGAVTRLAAERVPHIGWNTVNPAPGSRLFAGLGPDTRFYFVHSYAASGARRGDAAVSTAIHGGEFIAAIEFGPLSATQFHPEKSGDAGATLLRNWVGALSAGPLGEPASDQRERAGNGQV